MSLHAEGLAGGRRESRRRWAACALVAGAVVASAAPSVGWAQSCGTGWAAAGAGLNGPVRALHARTENSAQALYAGGLFSASGATQAINVARWNGVLWQPLGTGVNGEVLALGTFGNDLVVGGAFTAANDGTPGTTRIARWDGLRWHAFASGFDANVRAVAEFDGSLFAAGFFTNAGAVPARRIARWTGTGWTALGTGLNGGVYALTVWDDGNGGGEALFVGGAFTDAGGAPAKGVARWKNGVWSALSPAGIGAAGVGGSATIRALLVTPPGIGGFMCAAGSFGTAGGAPANNIARWNGAFWSQLGAGITGSQIECLSVFDDGAGLGLFAGGVFTSAGGAPATNIAKWDGSTWQALGAGANDAVSALEVFDESAAGRAPSLFAGGAFTSAGGVSASRVARYGAFGCVGPVITQQPMDVTAAPGRRAELSVQVAGSEPLTFQWRRQGAALNNGFSVSGATTHTLVINPATILDMASYDIVVSGPGGSVKSSSALLTIEPLCPGDSSGDGRVNFIDITAILVDWGRSYLPFPGTGSGDANGDGIVNFDDITETLSNWGRECELPPH